MSTPESDDLYANDAAHAEPEPVWLRLHPATILDDAVRRIPNVIIGLFLILSSGGGDAAIELIQLVIGFLAIAPVVVRYVTGRYRVDAELVQWRMGVVTKVHTDLPRHRIQSVDTQISVVGRVLGLESVVISSAGGDSEIRVGLIDARTAEGLRNELAPDIARANDSVEAAGESGEDTSDVIDLATLGASDLPRVMLVDITRMVGLLALGTAGVSITVALFAGWIGFGSIIFAVPLALGALGVARGLVTEAVGFSSRLLSDRVRVARGLVARSSLDAPLARVQGMTVKRTWSARRIETERISIDTADVSEEGSNTPGQSQTLVHPIARMGTWRDWAPTFLRSAVPDRDRVRRVAPVSLRRRWLAVLRSAIIPWAVLAIAAWIASARLSESVVLSIALGAAVVLPLIAGTAETLRYRNERWSLGTEQVAFRGGAVTTTLVLVPRLRTQGAEVRATWFQRRLGIADVTVDTASPTVVGTARDLYLDDAVGVAEAVLASADAEGGV